MENSLKDGVLKHEMEFHFRFNSDGTYEKISLPSPIFIINESYASTLDPETRKFAEMYFKDQTRKKTESLWVIYTSSCRKKSCKQENIVDFFGLDRYPMSLKILSSCHFCKKSDVKKISDPIMFHDSLMKVDVNLKDLCTGSITIHERSSNYEEALLRYWLFGRKKMNLPIPKEFEDCLKVFW